MIDKGDKEKNKGHRNYCFTSYNYPEGPTIDIEHVQYYIYQLEKCPTTNKLHYQGYIELKKVMRLSAIKKIFSDETCHFEERKGTQEQAIIYCSKLDTRQSPPVIYGIPAIQGKRKGLIDVLSTSIVDIIKEDPLFYLKYHKGINEIKAVMNPCKDVQRELYVTVLWGAPGTGKTRFVYDAYKMSNIYKLNVNTNNTL